MLVKHIHNTPDAEEVIAYCARVSSPHQDNPEIDKLLHYCIKHAHWSIFEMASMCVEITTSRAIAQQILRHRSFSFQEFSQRYAYAEEFEYIQKARSQDSKNRQNSIDDLPEDTRDWFYEQQLWINATCKRLYEACSARGIAKECARILLPLSVQTKLYMHGTIRSWIHYIQTRTDPSTQLEHREIAERIKGVFVQRFPVIATALGW